MFIIQFILLFQKCYLVQKVFPLGLIKDKLIKMRNPLGQTQWHGKYHSDSGLWTEQLYKKVGFVKDEIEVFYMTLKEFSETFESISVCAYREGYLYQLQKIPLNLKMQDKGSTYFSIKVDEEQDVCFRVHEYLEILGKSINVKYQYCSVDFLLFSDQILNKKSVGLLEVGSKDKYYGHSAILLTDINFGYIRLLPGRYMIKVRVYSNNNDVLRKKGVVLSCYSEGKVRKWILFIIDQVEIERLERNEKQRILDEFYFNLGNQNAQQVADHCRFACCEDGDQNVVLFIQNCSKDQTIKATFGITNQQNVRLGKRNRTANDEFCFEILPQKSEYCLMHPAVKYQGMLYKLNPKFVQQNSS